MQMLAATSESLLPGATQYTDHDLTPDIRSWADIPTALLQSELARRQNGDLPERPACGGKNKGSYNTPVHVGALLLILTLSTIGTSSPSRVLSDLLLTCNSSMRFSHYRPQIPSPPNSSPVHLPLAPLRNWRPHSHGLCASLSYRLLIIDGPMSPILLEPTLSCDAGVHCYDLSLHSSRHRTVLCHARRRTHPQQ